MTAAKQEEVSLPWYRYGMVWLIIGLLMTVVVASMVTVKIAFNNAPVVLEQKTSEPAVQHESDADLNE